MGKFTKKRNRSIVLSELGIKKGEKLQFVPGAGVFTDIYVTVVDDNNVEYNGEIMSRAEFNKKNNHLQRQGTATKEQQSTRYLYYKGNSLAELWKTYCEKGEILKPKHETKKEKKEKNGYVYIFTNPSFKEGIYKCGNSKDYKQRLKELFTTGVPTPFTPFAVIYVPDCNAVEQYFHEMMDLQGTRVSKNREFFNGNPNIAKENLYLIVNTFFKENGKIII